MEEFASIAMNSGLGVASFIALILFIFKYQKESNETMKEISKTMVESQITLATLADRVDKIEEKIK